jgi:predicted PurR-regulated permease PerM
VRFFILLAAFLLAYLFRRPIGEFLQVFVVGMPGAAILIAVVGFLVIIAGVVYVLAHNHGDRR